MQNFSIFKKFGMPVDYAVKRPALHLEHRWLSIEGGNVYILLLYLQNCVFHAGLFVLLQFNIPFFHV